MLCVWVIVLPSFSLILTHEQPRYVHVLLSSLFPFLTKRDKYFCTGVNVMADDDPLYKSLAGSMWDLLRPSGSDSGDLLSNTLETTITHTLEYYLGVSLFAECYVLLHKMAIYPGPYMFVSLPAIFISPLFQKNLPLCNSYTNETGWNGTAKKNERTNPQPQGC